MSDKSLKVGLSQKKVMLTKKMRSSARWGRDSLCPAGAAFVSTMPAPSGFLDGAGCEKIVGS